MLGVTFENTTATNHGNLPQCPPPSAAARVGWVHLGQALRTEPDTASAHPSRPTASHFFLDVLLPPWGLPRRWAIGLLFWDLPQAIWGWFCSPSPILPDQLGPKSRIRTPLPQGFISTRAPVANALLLNHIFYWIFPLCLWNLRAFETPKQEDTFLFLCFLLSCPSPKATSYPGSAWIWRKGPEGQGHKEISQDHR